MFCYDGITHKQLGIVWRKIVFFVFENNKPESINESICRIAGDASQDPDTLPLSL
jgi:hypothetical protein